MGQLRFENSIGMSNGWANKVGDSIREVTLQKIVDVYPELNIVWLKSGFGSMIVGNGNATSDTPTEGPTDCEERDAKVIPLLPISAQAGTLNDFEASLKETDCEKIVSPIKGAEYAHKKS